MSAAAWVGVAVAAAGATTLVWGWIEAGWVRLRTIHVAVPGLPPELDGLRVVHLSDFHLGFRSRGTLSVRKAVDWAAARKPDLIAITGDLVSHPRGEATLRGLLRSLPHCYAILGNHDVAASRDPFSKAVEIRELEPAVLLLDEGRELDARGKLVWVAGFDPGSRNAEPDLAHDADLRIVLSHFPSVLDRLPEGTFDLVLAGHMHDGQICIPYPGGKLRLAHPAARYTHGVYRKGSTVMHVSPGLGTTFVPFRFFARPEATELVLTCATGDPAPG